MKNEPLQDLNQTYEHPQEGEVVHEENEWGIELVDETINESAIEGSESPTVMHGIRVAYTVPERSLEQSANSCTEPENVAKTSLEELMGQLKNL